VKKVQAPGGLETSEALGAKLDALEKKMDRLRAMYESYFLGLDKRPPEVPRAELQRLMLDMQQTSIRNAALRFRFQTLQQRWASHLNHWNRVLREIESGTYRRDVERTQRRIAQRGETLGTSEAIALGIPAARAQAFVDRHNKEAQKHVETHSEAHAEADGDAHAEKARETTSQPEPNPQPQPSSHLSDEEVGTLLSRWRQATRQLGQPDNAPSADKLRRQLEAQIPKILRERSGQKVHFDVATREGKVVIRVKKIEWRPPRRRCFAPGVFAIDNAARVGAN